MSENESKESIEERIPHGDHLLRQGLYFEALRYWNDLLEWVPEGDPIRTQILSKIAKARKKRQFGRALMVTSLFLCVILFLTWGITSYREEQNKEKSSEAKSIYEQLNKLVKQGDLAKAKDLYTNLKTLYPKSQYVEKAEKDIEDLADYYKFSKEKLEKAEKLAKGEDFSSARKTLEDVLKEKHYSESEITSAARENKIKAMWAEWLKKAEDSLKKQNLEDALKAFEQANRISPEIGEKPKDLDELVKMIDKKKKLEFALHLFKGQKFLYKEQWKEAREELASALSRFPDDKKVRNLLNLAVAERFPKDMVFIPEGPFIMGGVEQPDELPPHIVELAPYLIDKYEVSNKDYAVFIKDTGGKPPEGWDKDNPPEGTEDLPVTNVTWYDAVSYASWTKKRLPSEAEWEKAARGIFPENPEEIKDIKLPDAEFFLKKLEEIEKKDKGEQKSENISLSLPRPYPWGDYWDPDLVSRGKASSVFSNPQGRSFFGVYNMAGNAWEWVDDWYKPYHPKMGSKYFGEKFKVIRGGGWRSQPDDMKTANRSAYQPSAYFPDVGFRCAMSLE